MKNHSKYSAEFTIQQEFFEIILKIKKQCSRKSLKFNNILMHWYL